MKRIKESHKKSTNYNIETITSDHEDSIIIHQKKNREPGISFMLTKENYKECEFQNINCLYSKQTTTNPNNVFKSDSTLRNAHPT
jgi:hypothetical protein